MLSAFSALSPALSSVRTASHRATAASTALTCRSIASTSPPRQKSHRRRRRPSPSATSSLLSASAVADAQRRRRQQDHQLRSQRKRQRPQQRVMKVAVVGCAHGELDALYAAVAELERAADTRVDLIICPGDFQAVRDAHDLQSLACPPHYRDMRSFWKFYDGTAAAPVPTLFVGGNHEASNHLQELPFGGLVAPNIYFLGNAGVVSVAGLRIAGLSGVYTERDYARPRRERPPYDRQHIKSVYHTRKQDVDRLLRLARPVDVFISHDWPRGIVDHGNLRDLLAAKPFLAAEVYSGSFGNPAATALLDKLQPAYWFAAHMHVKFPAIVRHGDSGKRTKFLALDKIVRRHDFIQLLDIPVRDAQPLPGMGVPATSRNEHESAAEKEGAATASVESEGGAGAGRAERTIELDSEWLTILRTEAAASNRETSVTNEEMIETMQHLRSKGVPLVVRPESDFEAVKKSRAANPPSGQRDVSAFRLQPHSEQLFEALGLPVPENLRTINFQDPVEALRRQEVTGPSVQGPVAEGNTNPGAETQGEPAQAQPSGSVAAGG